jgi:hypothetical protein
MFYYTTATFLLRISTFFLRFSTFMLCFNFGYVCIVQTNTNVGGHISIHVSLRIATFGLRYATVCYVYCRFATFSKRRGRKVTVWLGLKIKVTNYSLSDSHFLTTEFRVIPHSGNYRYKVKIKTGICLLTVEFFDCRRLPWNH